jgi:hypothetical protein
MASPEWLEGNPSKELVEGPAIRNVEDAQWRSSTVTVEDLMDSCGWLLYHQVKSRLLSYGDIRLMPLNTSQIEAE